MVILNQHQRRLIKGIADRRNQNWENIGVSRFGIDLKKYEYRIIEREISDGKRDIKENKRRL